MIYSGSPTSGAHRRTRIHRIRSPGNLNSGQACRCRTPAVPCGSASDWCKHKIHNRSTVAQKFHTHTNMSMNLQSNTPRVFDARCYFEDPLSSASSASSNANQLQTPPSLNTTSSGLEASVVESARHAHKYIGHCIDASWLSLAYDTDLQQSLDSPISVQSWKICRDETVHLYRFAPPYCNQNECSCSVKYSTPPLTSAADCGCTFVAVCHHDNVDGRW